MEQRFIVNPFKCAAGLVSCLCLMTAGASMIPISRYGSTAVFFALALVFGFIAAQNGAVIRVDGTGVRKSILGFCVNRMSWSDIGEIGVTGTKVFNRNHPEKTGGLYLYISRTSMTEQERFEMTLKWPPADKIYLTCNDRRLGVFLSLWNHKIETHNIGNLVL